MDRVRALGRPSPRLAAVALVAGCVFALGSADIAAAGTYHVYACRTPTGSTAPTDGWGMSHNGAYASTGDSCAGGGSLSAVLDGSVSHPFGDQADLAFHAPANTDIAAITLWRAGTASPGQAYGSPGTTIQWDNATGGPTVVDQCYQAYGCSSAGTTSSPLAASNAISSGGLTGVTGIEGIAVCSGGPGGTCPATGGAPTAALYLYGADITLRDPSNPAVSSVQGGLVGGGTLAGTENVSFNATDSGSGLYSLLFEVDGHSASRQVLDTNDGRCVDLGSTGDGTHAFGYVVPCKLSLSPSVGFDTTQLTAGAHHLRLIVDDAAGNTTGAYDGQITVNNGPTNVASPQLSDASGGQSVFVGDTLNVNPGQWNPTPTSYSYSWQTCAADGTSCQPLTAASGSSYSLSASDVGHRLLAAVTARTASGATTLDTAYSPVVATAPVGSSASGAGLQGAPTTSGAGAGGSVPPGAGGQPALAHIANGVTPCGSPTLDLRFRNKPSVTVAYGKDVTLHGKLACGGAPIRGAVISIASAPISGSTLASTGDVITATDGSFAYVAPSGPSRSLTATYKAYADDAQPAVAATAKLSVTPQISLKIAPHSTRNHRRIVWRGRVLGGPIPAAGLPLDLQYRDGRRWRTFDQVRAKRNGTFSYRYTFQRTTRATTYSFRVALPAGGVVGYPYSPSWSVRRSVRVRP
jgi:hypothetical protein